MTLSLSKKRQKAVNEGTNNEAAWRARYDFLKDAVEDDLDELLDGKKFDEIDLVALDALFLNVCQEYDRPINEAIQDTIRAELSALESFDDEKINSMLSAAQEMNRQGFKNVR